MLLDTALAFYGVKGLTGLAWEGEKKNINFTVETVRSALLELDKPIWVSRSRETSALLPEESLVWQTQGRTS